MFIKGHKTSQIVNDALTDLAALKKPFALKYNKKESNKQNPFESENTVEFFAYKSDASLFMYGCHSKKRPHNLVVGRMFDHHLLDMMEFGITNFKPISSFPSLKQCRHGSKPLFAVIGSVFNTDYRFKTASNMLVDFYRGEVIDSITLAGLDHVIVLSATDNADTILFRHYAIEMKRSGTKVPKVVLVEIGPSIDLVLRRERLAAPSLQKEAMKKPGQLRAKKKKNISHNVMGDTLGTVHVKAQSMDKMTANVVPAKALRGKGGKRWREETSSTEEGKERGKRQKRMPEGL